MDLMRFLAKIVVAVVANAIGLVASAYFVPGFTLANDPQSTLIVAAALTALNFFLKPILKLVLGPVIFLTLGLGVILVNALILYVLTLLVDGLTISGIPAYLMSALIVGFTNFIFHLATKK